jgi:hypothetical protein
MTKDKLILLFALIILNITLLFIIGIIVFKYKQVDKYYYMENYIL